MNDIKVFSRYGDPRKQATRTSGEVAHGLAPSQIARLSARMDEFTPSLVSKYGAVSDALDGILPEGATLSPGAGQGYREMRQKHANMNGAGFSGGGNGVFQTADQPYQPEFASPDRQQYPVHRILANRIWRMFYKLDHIIGTGIDMYAELPWGNVEFSGDGVDGEVRDMMEYAWDECQMRTILPSTTREFFVVGEAAPHLFWDNDKNVWTYCALHNPDQLQVIDAPFIKMDPVVEFVPDQRLQEVLTSNHQMLRQVRESMPKELLVRLMSRQNIPLSPVNFTFLPRKLHSYDTRGTSIISRMWRILMYEDAVYNASIATARRHAGPLKVAKLGNPQTGWIPGPDQERKLHELLASAELDVNAWLIYHHGINFELIGTTDRVMSIDKHNEIIERVKLIALGISKAFLHGEVTYACLPHDTHVQSPEGLVNIQDLRHGDMVIAGDGSTQTVVKAWCEGTPETLTELTVSGSRTVSSTSNHRWPVYRDGEVLKLPAEEVRVGDALLSPRKFDERPTDVTVEQARRWCIEHAGKGAHQKKLSSAVMSWPLYLKEHLIRGAFLGDGSQTLVMRGSHGPYLQVAYTTASKTLALQLWQVCIQLGFYGSMMKRDAREGWPEHWSLQFQSTYAIGLSDLVWGEASLAAHVKKRRSHTPEVWMDAEYAYMPVKRVATVSNDQPVYNIEVTGPHTYIAEGLATHNSAASGLTVFLQRLKALRQHFESAWLMPKFFFQMARMNKWVRPTEAELNHRVRIRRSHAELAEDARYVLPRLEWDRTLDPAVDSEMLGALSEMQNLGVKFSKSTIASLAGRDFEEETKQRVVDWEFEQKTIPPEMVSAEAVDEGGLGGGGGGVGGVLPGMDPAAFGDDLLPPDEGGGGEVDVPAEAAVQAEDGAAEHEHASGGDPFKDRDRINIWTKSDIEDLIQLFEGEQPDDEPWLGAYKDPDVRHALGGDDAEEIWEAVEDYLAREQFPSSAVKALVDILKQLKIVRGNRHSDRRASRASEAQLIDMIGGYGGGELLTGVK